MHLSESSVSLENNQIHTQREVERRGREKGEREEGTMLWSLTPTVKGWCMKGPEAKSSQSGPFNKAGG